LTEAFTRHKQREDELNEALEQQRVEKDEAIRELTEEVED
jgi:hypothetical protein